MYDWIQQAVDTVKQQRQAAPRVGVVLGSGLGVFAERVQDATVIPYAAIPHFPTSGVAGHKGELVLGSVGGVPVAVMSGRVHAYEGHAMERVTFPVRVLAGLGVRRLIVTNAAGAIRPDFRPGDFMVLTDHINLTGQNPLTGPNDERLGPRFPDMSRAYGPLGQQSLQEAGQGLGVSLWRGVYAGLGGPSYETPAEIRMLRALGADAVGMSTVAEVIVAAHAGLEVAGLSVITNQAAGLAGTPLTHEEVQQVGQRVRDVLCELLARAVVRFDVG